MYAIEKEINESKDSVTQTPENENNSEIIGTEISDINESETVNKGLGESTEEENSNDVWIVPHRYLGDKIAIYPYGLIFISDKIPLNLRGCIVLHEVVEEKW